MSFSSLMNKKPGISIHNNKGQTLLYLAGGPGEAEIIQEKDLGPDHTSTFNSQQPRCWSPTRMLEPNPRSMDLGEGSKMSYSSSSSSSSSSSRIHLP